MLDAVHFLRKERRVHLCVMLGRYSVVPTTQKSGHPSPSPLESDTVGLARSRKPSRVADKSLALRVFYPRKCGTCRILAFILCGLLGIGGAILIIISVGGGFDKPKGQKKLCNSTEVASLSCLSRVDKTKVNSRAYTNACFCERAEVSFQVATGDFETLRWETRRSYGRNFTCAAEYPTGNFTCYHYPDGDPLDRVTLYSYGDKVAFRESTLVWAVGLSIVLAAFVFIMLFATSYFCPSLSCVR